MRFQHLLEKKGIIIKINVHLDNGTILNLEAFVSKQGALQMTSYSKDPKCIFHHIRNCKEQKFSAEFILLNSCASASMSYLPKYWNNICINVKFRSEQFFVGYHRQEAGSQISVICSGVKFTQLLSVPTKTK